MDVVSFCEFSLEVIGFRLLWRPFRRVKIAFGYLAENAFHPAAGMSHPSHLALVNHESGGDAPPTGGLHPFFAHEFVGVVHGYAVLHLRAHIFHEGGDFIFEVVAAFPDIHADEGDIGELLRQFGQVGDCDDAGTAPSGPELHDIGLGGIEFGDGFAFYPFPYVQLGSWRADDQRFGRGLVVGRGCAGKGVIGWGASKRKGEQQQKGNRLFHHRTSFLRSCAPAPDPMFIVYKDFHANLARLKSACGNWGVKRAFLRKNAHCCVRGRFVAEKM